MNISCVVFKVNLVKNIEQWWVETGVTRHICAAKRMFSTYKEMDEENLYMRNSKMNVMAIVTNDENNNKIVSSFYLFESYGVWHSSLGHLKSKTL